MSGLKKILIDSFQLIKKCPQLFFPKLLIAALNSAPMLFMPSLISSAFDLSQDKSFLLTELGFFLLFLFFVLLLDVLFNSMYSFTAKNYLKEKKINLKKDFFFALNKFSTVLPSVLLTEAISVSAIILISVPLALAFVSGNNVILIFLAVLSLLIIFVLYVLFYLIYPVSSLEEFSALNSVKISVKKAKNNFKKISEISVIAMLLSLVSMGLPFLFDSSIGFYSFMAFLLVRLLTALVATYYYVLLPVFYLEAELK
ncbi:MAG: hypothetical protein ABIA76_04470 [Candidatus Diapherotrites archaeon]